jgi:hypothetical protein
MEPNNSSAWIGGGFEFDAGQHQIQDFIKWNIPLSTHLPFLAIFDPQLK